MTLPMQDSNQPNKDSSLRIALHSLSNELSLCARSLPDVLSR